MPPPGSSRPERLPLLPRVMPQLAPCPPPQTRIARRAQFDVSGLRPGRPESTRKLALTVARRIPVLRVLERVVRRPPTLQRRSRPVLQQRGRDDALAPLDRQPLRPGGDGSLSWSCRMTLSRERSSEADEPIGCARRSLR